MLRNRLYYSVKPHVPYLLRLGFRKWLARRKLPRVRNEWPIVPGSERPPEGWQGWPQGKRFALVLTHDVEGQAGLNKAFELMEVEKKLGFRSSYNLIPRGEYEVTRELRETITHEGFEVAVHDCYHDGKLFLTEAEFKRNTPLINRYLQEWGAVGFRSGFMLHNLSWLHELDIEYDLSTFDTDPFEPQPEGRHTIFPFWVARSAECKMQNAECPREERGRQEPHERENAAPSAFGKTLNSQLSTLNDRRGYVELPYTLPQDSTLFLLLGEQGPHVWNYKLDWIAKHEGMALVNVHPDYIRFKGERPSPRTYSVEKYTGFLEHALTQHEGQYWQPLPRALAEFCSANEAGNSGDKSAGARRQLTAFS